MTTAIPLTVLVTAFCYLFFAIASAAEVNYYTAAVFEHASFRSENASAKEMVLKNLYFYTKATIAAKSEGADIIVFPEYGIFTASSREEIKKFLEDIPDPKLTRINPCEEFDAYSDRVILQSLSCMAKENSIYVVANMGDIQDCEGDPECPADGVFHFNTNVVFDRNGTLVLKYHKEHLFFEKEMDLARKQQDTTFKTDFGTFATYICFDLVFERMRNVSQEVDGIIFSTMWFFLGPQYVSVQTFQGWAIGNNATLIAANTHVMDFFSIGSGIFHKEHGALGYTYNPDGISKLVVARVPKKGYLDVPEYNKVMAITETDEWDVKDDGKDVPLSCPQHFEDNNKKPLCFEENTSNYTFVKLKERSGHLEACNSGMCCTLDYTAAEVPENFYLGVYNGSHNSFDRYIWCEENCVVVRCEAVGPNPCGTFSMKSDAVFHHAQLKADFSTRAVYPSVVESGMRVVPRNEWYYRSDTGLRHKSVINMKSQKGRNLLSMGFKGRCFDRDPPYVR